MFPRQTKRTDIGGVAVISSGALEAATLDKLCPAPLGVGAMRVKGLLRLVCTIVSSNPSRRERS